MPEIPQTDRKIQPRRTRRMRGFEAASGLLREPIRKVGETRGFAASRLLTHWAEIVGADAAALCRPVKVSYAQGGFGATLTVLASGAAAQLVQMQIPRLIERVNACYGYAAIAHIKVTQTTAQGYATAQGFAEAQAPFAGAAAGPSPQVMAQARKMAGELTQGMADGGLKAALERLAENVLTRQKGAKVAQATAEREEN